MAKGSYENTVLFKMFVLFWVLNIGYMNTFNIIYKTSFEIWVRASMSGSMSLVGRLKENGFLAVPLASGTPARLMIRASN